MYVKGAKKLYRKPWRVEGTAGITGQHQKEEAPQKNNAAINNNEMAKKAAKTSPRHRGQKKREEELMGGTTCYDSAGVVFKVTADPADPRLARAQNLE